MAYEVSRKSPIGELVFNCPASASVLLEHGFHCIGCGLSAYETLEEGASAHGMDDGAIDALVKKIQEASKREEELLSNPPAAKAPEKKTASSVENPAPRKGKKSKKASKSG